MKSNKTSIASTLVIMMILISSLSGTLMGLIPATQNDSHSPPSPAVSAPTAQVFPTANAELYAHSPYNLTAGVQNNPINNSFDSANLEVEKEGSPYANESLTPLGTFGGTYSFADDAVGGLAAGWTYDSGASAQVYEEKLGHQKVLGFTGTGAWKYINIEFATTTVVTIEFWACFSAFPTSGDDDLFIILNQAMGTSVYLAVRTMSGVTTFAIQASSVYTPIHQPLYVNRWYFVSIIANAAMDTCDIAVDGNVTKSLPFYGAATSFAGFRMGCYSASITDYVDAVSVTPDLTGGVYSSEMDFDDFAGFGNYSALYTFDTDANGVLPAGWTGLSAQVNASLSDHVKIVNVTAGSITNSFISKTTGTVEFWIYATGAQVSFVVGNSIYIYFQTDGTIVHWSRSSTFPVLGVYVKNAWVHTCLAFNYTSDTYDFYINGTSLAYNLDTHVVADSVSQISLSTASSSFYIDAVDYSWATNYAGQRNMCNYVQGWELYGSSNYAYAYSSYTVEANKDGHANALGVNKTAILNGTLMRTTFAAQTLGIIEWWFYLSAGGYGTTGPVYFTLFTDTSVKAYLQVYSSGQVVMVDSGWTSTPLGYISRGAWHHFRWFFYTVGDTSDLYVDGYRRGSGMSFLYPAVYVNALGIVFDKATIAKVWIDSIDYSWSPGYAVNRNWRTLSDPDPTVSQGEVGVYNATYTFEAESPFGMPFGWKNGSGIGCQTYIVPQSFNATLGHRNVLCLNDQSAATQAIVNCTISSPSAVEFWVMTSDVTKQVGFYFFKDNTAALYATQIYIVSSNLYSYSGSAAQLLQTAYPNVWYHVRVSLDYVNYKYSVWVNGLLKQSNLAFQSNIESAGLLYIATETTPTGYQVYYDAVDVSSDVSYFAGRNTYMLCNRTQTFSSPGSYSFRHQAWKAGVDYSSAWTPFTVVDNVQLLSSASRATQWTFADLSSAPSWSSVYASNFATETYTLTPSSGQTQWVTGYGTAMYTANFGAEAYTISGSTTMTVADSDTGDTCAISISPTTNYGSSSYAIVQTVGASWDHALFAFTPVNATYLGDSSTYNTTYSLYAAVVWGSADGFDMYAIPAFGEYTVTWNNQPTLGALIYASGSATDSMWGSYSIAGYQPNIFFKTPNEGTDNSYIWFATKEEGSHTPYATVSIPKFYNTTGLCWIQTNTTESLNLTSPVFASKTVATNDRMYFTYTTTGSGLYVQLLNGGVIQQTYPLASTVDITAPCTFTQIRIYGAFDNTENLQVTSIIVKPATYTQKLVQTASYVLEQTNTVETLTLDSPNTLSLSINTSCRVTLSYLYNTTHAIYLYLKQSGVIKQTYTVIAEGGIGNTVFSVTGTNIITQFEFAGAFSASAFRLLSITVEQVTYTAPVYDFYVNAMESLPVSLPTSTYSLVIQPYPNTGDVLLSQLATVASYSLNVISYSPFTGGECQVNLYDEQYRLLDFGNFRVILNRTSNGITSPVNTLPPYYMSTNRFYADAGSLYNCTVYDVFGQVVYNVENATVTPFIDLRIPGIYSVKIQNRMQGPTLITLTRNASYPQYLAEDEIVEFQLYAGVYELNYTNPELFTNVSVSLAISATILYVFNSSYYSIYFSAFSNDLLGLPRDTVRLYVDGDRKEWGPIELLNAYHNVTALDFFNDTQYTAVLDLSSFAEFNVFVNMASLSLFNNDSENYFTFNITKGGRVLLSQPVAPDNFLIFRFTTGAYVVDAYYANNTLYSTQLVNLAANDTQLLSFGAKPAHWYTFNIIPVTPQGLGLPWEQFLLKIGGVPAAWGVHSLPNTIINVEATDFFGNVVNSTSFALSDGVNCLVMVTTHVYKVSNLMRTSTLVNWTRNGLSWTEYVEPGETTRWDLFAGIYILEYVQTETGTPVSIPITVSGPGRYTINTSYYAVYISAYSADAPNIPLDSFKLYIDGVQYFWGWNELLADSYAFVVKDWFDANVYAAMRSVSDNSPINLPLSIYSFKIQNLMRNDTYVRLASPGGILEKYLLAGTEDEVFVGTGNYQLLYTQTETSTPVTYNFVLTGATRYVINTSYYRVYFFAFSNDGLGIPADTVCLYVNGTRCGWGSIELLGAWHNVTVLDYTGEVQYSGTVDLSHVTEFNVFVNIASMVITNQMRNESIAVIIKKGGTLLQNQTIGNGNGLVFRFTNGLYTVYCTYQNGTVVTLTVDVLASGTDLKTYTLSFGSWEEPVLAPEQPPTAWEVAMPYLALVIVAVGIVVAFGLVVRDKNRKLRKARGYATSSSAVHSGGHI